MPYSPSHPSIAREQWASTVLAVILAALGILGFMQLRTSLAQRNTTKNASITHTKELQEMLTILQDAEKAAASLKEPSEVQKINAMVPTTPNIPDILENLETLARSKGLILNSIAIHPLLTKGSLATLTLDVEFSGLIDYPLWKSLLNSLETNVRLFEITRAQFNPTKPTLTMSLVTFSLTPQDAASTTADPLQLLNNEEFKNLRTPRRPTSVSPTPGSPAPFVHPPMPTSL